MTWCVIVRSVATIDLGSSLKLHPTALSFVAFERLIEPGNGFPAGLKRLVRGKVRDGRTYECERNGYREIRG